MKLSLLAVSVCLGAVGAGCHDATGPGHSSPVGSYTSTVFRSTQFSVTTDVLAAGGSLSLLVMANGTTSGLLFVPASITGDTAINASMVGTYSLTGDTLRLIQGIDTFVRDMPFAVRGDSLVGTRFFGATQIQLVMLHQPGT